MNHLGTHTLLKLNQLEGSSIKQFIEVTDNIFWMYSLRESLTYISPQVIEKLGYQPIELLTRPLCSLIHPQDLGICHSFLEEIIYTGKHSTWLEIRVRSKYRIWQWLLSNASPTKDEQGNIIGIHGIARSITKTHDYGVGKSKDEFGSGGCAATPKLILKTSCRSPFQHPLSFEMFDPNILSEQQTSELLQINRQLLQEIEQHYQTERELNLQIERLNCLYHLVLDLNNAPSIDTIYQIAIKGIKQALGGDSAAVIAPDKNGILRYQAVLGISPNYQQAIEQHLENAIEDFEEKTVIIADAQSQKGSPALDAIREDEGIQASAAFPLRYQGEHLGKIIVYYDEPHQFTAEEIKLAKTITTYVATAITRKKSEAALQQSKEQLEAVLNAVPGLISWISADLRYQGVNQRLADVYELEPEFFINQPIGFLNIHDDFTHFIRSFFNQEESYISQEMEIHEQNQVKTFLSIAQKYNSGQTAVFVQVDISDRKQVEEALRRSEEESRQLYKQLQAELGDRKYAEIQLQQTNERLEVTITELARATKLKDEFLANMSHELRTPLNVILGLSEGLLDEVYSPLNQRQQRAIATIEKSGQHLLALINDILDLTKIESGKLNLNLHAVSVRSLCDSSINFIRSLAVQKNIQISIQIAESVGFIEADERRLCQVLINLLSNAVKFTPEGGQVTLEAKLHEPALLHLSVTDTGIGIAPKDIGKLFRSFVQVDSSLNRQYSGTGLGLALVKRITELHGGHVSVHSRLGAGSCFSVLLPISSWDQ